MEVYIALLRGINVGGKNSLKMAAWKSICEDQLNFSHVTTYIQSGNMVFASNKKDTLQLAATIQQTLLQTFTVSVPVCVFTALQWQAIVANNPYTSANIAVEKLHATLLQPVPSVAFVSELDNTKFLPDVFTIKGCAAYLHIPEGYSNSKLSNSFFEKKLQVLATTRNWKTVLAIQQIVEDITE